MKSWFVAQQSRKAGDQNVIETECLEPFAFIFVLIFIAGLSTS